MTTRPSSGPGASWASLHLEAERAVTLERLRSLDKDFDGMVSASADSNADDEHDPEGATIAFERSQLVALIQQARRHLDEIEEAEHRASEGRYGVCETCGQPIGEARLQARPVARTCIRCAARPGR